MAQVGLTQPWRDFQPVPGPAAATAEGGAATPLGVERRRERLWGWFLPVFLLSL